MEIALLLLLAERRRVHRAVPSSEFRSLTITLIIKRASVGVIRVVFALLVVLSFT